MRRSVRDTSGDLGPRDVPPGPDPCAARGQIADSTLVAAPRQRAADGGKAQIEAGRTAAEVGTAKARRKDADARWTNKRWKAETRADGTKPIDIAIPILGQEPHVSMGRMQGIARGQIATDAARHDGARLREGLEGANTDRGVCANSAYRSAEGPGGPRTARSAASAVQAPRERPVP